MLEKYIFRSDDCSYNNFAELWLMLLYFSGFMQGPNFGFMLGLDFRSNSGIVPTAPLTLPYSKDVL